MERETITSITVHTNTTHKLYTFVV